MINFHMLFFVCFLIASHTHDMSHLNCVTTTTVTYATIKIVYDKLFNTQLYDMSDCLYLARFWQSKMHS